MQQLPTPKTKTFIFVDVNINRTAPKYNTDNSQFDSKLMSQAGIGRVLPELYSKQKHLTWKRNCWTVFAAISIKDLAIRPKVQGRQSREIIELPLRHHMGMFESVGVTRDAVRPPMNLIHFPTFSL